MQVSRTADLAANFSLVGHEYVANLKLVRHAPDETAIHDLRVATRRLAAIVHVCEKILAEKESKKLLRKLSKLMHCLGAARDAQLKLAEIDKMRRVFRQLVPLQEDLRKEKIMAERKLAKLLLTYHPVEYRKIFFVFSEEITHYGLHHEKGWQLIRNDVLMKLEEYQSGFSVQSRILDVDNPAALHKVRIVAKKTRYLLELFPVLNGYESSGLETIKNLQAQLGAIQDGNTLVAGIDDFLKRKWMYRESIGPIRNELEQKMKRLSADIPEVLLGVTAALSTDVAGLKTL